MSTAAQLDAPLASQTLRPAAQFLWEREPQAAARVEIRCARCGYGGVVTRLPGRCPMCGLQAWKVASRLDARALER